MTIAVYWEVKHQIKIYHVAIKTGLDCKAVQVCLIHITCDYEYSLLIFQWRIKLTYLLSPTSNLPLHVAYVQNIHNAVLNVAISNINFKFRLPTPPRHPQYLTTYHRPSGTSYYDALKLRKNSDPQPKSC